MKTIIIIQSSILFIVLVYMMLLRLLIIKRGRRLKELFDEAVNTDGSHHKQWYLFKIAKLLFINPDSDDEGIAP